MTASCVDEPMKSENERQIMKAIHTMTAVAVALLAAGCEPQHSPNAPEQPKSMTPDANAPPPKAEPTPPAAQQNITLPKAVQPPPEATQIPAGGDKAQFVASVEQKLKHLDAKIAELGEKVKPSDQAAKQDLTSLQELRAKADAKFTELKQSAQDAWMEIKPQLEVAMIELEKTCQDLLSKITS